ncbi:hypothetical protein HY497_01160 [Candidatus Woesearchaeota archaeon]|nr:hypothetical protein [Candidatus Woesearchaeota archaeon]
MAGKTGMRFHRVRDAGDHEGLCAGLSSRSFGFFGFNVSKCSAVYKKRR